MKLCVKNISIENFLSFKQADIDLTQSGFIQVCGENKNKDDSSTSNGTGKSSIFEAICWALTGETIRGVKKVKNIFSDDGALVDLRFSCDNDEYRVIRTQEHSKYKTNLLIYKNNEDISGKGIRDSEQILESILPDLTSQLIGSVVILGQGLPQRFTNNTPSGRKEVLEKLSKSDFMIEDLKVRVTKRKTDLTQSQLEFTKKLNTLQGKQQVLQTSIDRDTLDYEQLPNDSDIRNEILILEKQIEAEENKKTALREEYDKVKSLKWQVSMESTQVKSDIENTVNKISLRYVQEGSKISQKLQEAQITLNNLNKELNRYKNIKDICPTCGQKIIGIIKPDTSSIEQQIEENKIIIEQCNNDISILSATKKKETDEFTNSLKKKVDELDEQSLELLSKEQDLYAEIDKLNDTLNKYNTNKVELDSKLSKLEALRQTLLDRIVVEKNQLQDISNEILYNKTELEKINNHLDAVSKMVTVLNRDFRGFLLTNIIDYINAKAKVYCKDIFGNEQLNFQIDGNNLLITFRDKQYETLSGGEKQKVDIIIQLSLRDMLCNYLNFRCNIICFDEIFDNCDSLGCQKILNLISTKLPDIQGIYIITHHTDLDIPADAYIKVVKGEDNISYVER